MNILTRIFISLFFISALYSCTFQNEEDYFGEPICDSTAINRDTLNVYYEELTYIFSDNCASCHNSGFTYRQGIVMDSYENVIKSMNTGKVLPAIKHEGLYKMPNGQPKLSDCEIQKIAVWIENGMPKKTK
jgi:hypothetical protein